VNSARLKLELRSYSDEVANHHHDHHQLVLPVKQDRRIDVARTYLEQQLHRPIALSQLAAVSSLSVRQLTSLFQQHLGRSPQQYLLELRMHKARQLLESSDLQVQLVAEQVGYTNLAAFSDRFRRYYGKSPRHFRHFRQHNKQHR
jgi:transcriptional regulator GlxA family with amidase domain